MRLSHIMLALWFVPFAALNALIWRVIPCEWSQPYGDGL
jgi:hypothetical protein